MNEAEALTAQLIESTLAEHGSYQKLDERLYTIKQGSTFVLIHIVPWNEDKALVRCCAQVVRGVDMSQKLAVDLLHLNTQLRFGAFAFEPNEKIVFFLHSILGGKTLDADELLATLSDVAIIADRYDDTIVELFGGQRMSELLEESSLSRVLDTDPSSFSFDD